MSQSNVVSFGQAGIGFTLRNRISAEVIPQATISIKGVAVILFSLRYLIHQIRFYLICSDVWYVGIEERFRLLNSNPDIYPPPDCARNGKKPLMGKV